jgi:hypothetical protein
MEITSDEALQIFGKWQDEATIVRAIDARENGGFMIVGNIADMSATAIHITGHDCEMLLNLHDVISFDYKDSREAPSEVGEETKKEYPTVVEMNSGMAIELGFWNWLTTKRSPSLCHLSTV